MCVRLASSGIIHLVAYSICNVSKTRQSDGDFRCVETCLSFFFICLVPNLPMIFPITFNVALSSLPALPMSLSQNFLWKTIVLVTYYKIETKTPE